MNGPTAPRGRPPTWLALIGVVAVAWGANLGLQRWSAAGTAERLRQHLATGELRLISSVTCVYCARARAWLTEQRVPFDECFVERDAACMADYQRLGARGTPTVVVRGRVQLGFDARRVADVVDPS